MWAVVQTAGGKMVVATAKLLYEQVFLGEGRENR
jgi:hypothetical protein